MFKLLAHEEDVKTRKRFANVEPYNVEGVARRKLRRCVHSREPSDAKENSDRIYRASFRQAMHSTQADLAMLYRGPGNQKVAKRVLSARAQLGATKWGPAMRRKTTVSERYPNVSPVIAKLASHAQSRKLPWKPCFFEWIKKGPPAT